VQCAHHEEQVTVARAYRREAEALVWRASEAAASGAEPIIGPQGQFRSEHGFVLERLALAPGEERERPPIAERDVLFVHSGSVELRWNAAR
jgi:hypothetical protein